MFRGVAALVIAFSVLASPTIVKAATDSCNTSLTKPTYHAEYDPQPITPIAGKRLPNEGSWTNTKLSRHGIPVVKTTKLRFDKAHGSDFATLVWLDTSLVYFKQIAGFKVPKPGISDGKVPAGLKPCYLAGFTGGYLMKDSKGGAKYGKTLVAPMVKGQATLVSYTDGTLDIVKWPATHPDKTVAQARQNLSLLVDSGKSKVPKPEGHNAWGWVWNGTGINQNDVQRTGVGVRPDGTILWVLGRNLNATNLASLLIRGGAVRAMALDMNLGYSNAYMYGPYHSANKAGVAFDNRMTGSPMRFWGAAERDFVAVFTRP